MYLKSLGILISTCALLASATAASAQEVIIENDAAVVEEPLIVDDGDIAVIERPAAPRVYGWTALRPIDCGTFRYWNGVRCADARFDPPVD
jgi:hypothetical protein